MLVLQALNKITITKEEVREVVNEIEAGNAQGLDEFQFVFEETWSDCIRMEMETRMG